MSYPLFVIHEVEIHYSRPISTSLNRIKSFGDAEKFLREIIDVRKIDHKEFFWLVLLSTANEILGVAEIGRGSTSHVSVNAKEIFQLAIKANASGVLLAHNHPSGNLAPSEFDIRLTKKLKEIAGILDIIIYDHIILTSHGITSLFTEGIV